MIGGILLQSYLNINNMSSNFNKSAITTYSHLTNLLSRPQSHLTTETRDTGGGSV